ncbi:MAG: hypothetical protein RPR97_03210 [Colwellia sp.]
MEVHDVAPATPAKLNKNEKNKAWLSQSIRDLGEETLLHPKVTSDRHPYTKEVLLLAGRQGYSQDAMGGICGVSQSQISQWIDSQSKASFDQIGPLIDKLSPIAPGGSYHFRTVVKKTYLKLPEDWEVKMLQLHLDSRYSREQLSNMALAGVKSEESEAITELKDSFESDCKDTQDELDSLKDLKAAFQQEQEGNQSEIASWEQSCNEYMSDRPELEGLSAAKKEALLKREHPKPNEKTDKYLEYREQLEALAKRYEFELTENEEQVFLNIEACISKLLEETQLTYDEKCTRLTEFWSLEAEKRELFDRYSDGVDTSIILLDADTRDISEEVIAKHARALYGELCLTLLIKSSHGYEDRIAKVNMAEVFTEYGLSLSPSVDTEDVQVCGAKLTKGKFLSNQENLLDAVERVIESIDSSADNSNNIPNTHGIECYQLFGKKLAIEWSYKNDEKVDLTYMSVFENLTDTLDKIEYLLSITKMERGYSSWNYDRDEAKEEIISYFKRSLLESGYRLQEVRALY